MDDELDSISRRTALSALGAGAVGLSTASVSGHSGRSERVVLARGGVDDEALVTRSVPKRWLAHENAVDRIQERVLAPHIDGETVLGGGLVPSDRRVGGYTCLKPTFEVAPDAPQSAVDELPSSIGETDVKAPGNLRVDDIGVQTREHELGPGGCYAKYDVSAFPGGVFVDSSAGGFATSGIRIYDSDAGEELFYTNNHVLAAGSQADGDCVGGDGTTLEDDSGDVVGKGTGTYDVSHDWILVTKKQNIEDDIVTEEKNSGETKEDVQQDIDGYVTDDGLKTAASNSLIVEKFGVTSGWTTGYVEERGKYFSDGCYQFNFTSIKTSTTFAEGDSGGPCWIDFDGTTSVISTNMYLPYESTVSNCYGGTSNQGSYMISFPIWRFLDNNSSYSVRGGVENP